jgi:hypothetical protein
MTRTFRWMFFIHRAELWRHANFGTSNLKVRKASKAGSQFPHLKQKQMGSLR